MPNAPSPTSDSAERSTDSRAAAAAYLLTWNPERWAWAELPHLAEQLRTGHEVVRRWSTGNTKSIEEGARVYLYRQGSQGRGIVGSGRVVRATFEEPHWDEEKGGTANYVEVAFDALLDPGEDVLLLPSVLEGPELGDVHWGTQTSGIGLDDGVSQRLDALWTGWVDAQRTDGEGFLREMSAYAEDGVVFSSSVQGALYTVAGVDEQGADVTRLSASEPARVTASGYARAVRTVMQNGGRFPAVQLDATAAVRNAYFQGPELALSPSGDVAVLVTPEDAADLLIAHLDALRVDRSEGAPKPYQPAVIACVLDAIEAGDLTENRVPFDWLEPRFLAFLGARGVEATSVQAAYGYFYLSRKPFWLLGYSSPSGEAVAALDPPSRSKLTRAVTHARLGAPYWAALQHAEARAQVRAALEAWWPAEPAGGGDIEVDAGVLTRMVKEVIGPVVLDGDLLAEGGGEGYHHHKVLPTTMRLLSRESIEADPVGAVLGAIKAHVNLLSAYELMYAKTLLVHESTDPDDIRDHVLDLLYGTDDLAARVGRFTEWAHRREREDGATMEMNATVASYLLATSQPTRYAFCKPSVYKVAARALVGEAVGPAQPAERVAHATRLYEAVLERLREDHGVPFEDLMHVHIAFYVVSRYDKGRGWKQLVAVERSQVAEPTIEYEVDRTAFRRLFDRFVEEYAGEDRGALHLEHYAAARVEARRGYAAICERADAGDDVTDEVLLAFLPHKNTSGNRERGAWIHPAEAVTKDVRMWFEGAGWVAPEDWPAVTEALLRFVRTSADEPGSLADAVYTFEASSHGKGLQAGMLSPILSALRPEAYSVINSKAARLVNRLTGGAFDTRLSSYPETNAAARTLVGVAEEWIAEADLDADAEADVLDMMGHWLVTEGPPEDDSVPLAAPLDAVFASADEAEWTFDLLRESLGHLGVEEPGDPRVVITLPGTHGGTVLRLNFGPWLVLDYRGRSRGATQLGVTLRSEDGQALDVGETVGESFAEADGRPEQSLFLFSVKDARPMPPAIEDAIAASMAEIGDRFAGWRGSPYARHHQPQIEAAVFDDAARDALFRDGLDLPTPPDDMDQADARAWKVSPGDGAWQWEESREGGFIGIGWEDLGDLSGVAEAEFRRRQADAEERFGWTTRATNQVWRFATEIRVGDRIVANRGTTEVLGVGTVIGPYYFADGERHAHRLPVHWDDTTPKKVRFGHWRQTLLSIPQADFQEIVGPTSARGQFAPEYSLATCAEETGIAEVQLARWVRAIERKGQAVFYGPPGTGKTYLAERLARHLVGGTDGFVETVQFHPAYGYEDFVEGIRPRTEDGQLQYPLEPGRLLQFCAEAETREGRCVLVVDEINRANLSRVFGELMYLLEYRDREVTLASGQPFSIPANVRILGTMNTADRSIALVDHALRRRFAFVRLWPDFDVLTRYHRTRRTGFPVGALVGVLKALNEQIGDAHYAVGISYFLDEALGERIEDVWRMEIEPYLEEYFFDRPETVEPFLWPEVERSLSPEEAS